MRIALLQLARVPDDEAFEAGARACREAARLGADVAVLPELWQIGYRLEGDFAAHATSCDGAFVRGFAELARELELAIVVTYLEHGPRNCAALIDRHGELVLRYAKVHTCAFDLESALVPGDAFPCADLDIAEGPVRVGLMICFDREFPESARELMLGGAEVVLVPNACELTEDRIGQFRARAFENMTAMAMANYADDGGRSVAFSGIVFGAGGAPLDHTLVQADAEPGVYIADLDLAALRAYRGREVWGDAYRRPGAYGSAVRS
jgi:predicted amidohydrolase